VPYRIEVRPAALRQLGNLPRDAQLEVRTRIDALALDPRPRGCKKLSGSRDLYRVRVGEYRVVYQVQDRVLLIVLVKVGHRKDVYRR
jgi:mRNA interferase RelE/StbE